MQSTQRTESSPSTCAEQFEAPLHDLRVAASAAKRAHAAPSATCLLRTSCGRPCSSARDARFAMAKAASAEPEARRSRFVPFRAARLRRDQDQGVLYESSLTQTAAGRVASAIA